MDERYYSTSDGLLIRTQPLPDFDEYTFASAEKSLRYIAQWDDLFFARIGTVRFVVDIWRRKRTYAATTVFDSQ